MASSHLPTIHQAPTTPRRGSTASFATSTHGSQSSIMNATSDGEPASPTESTHLEPHAGTGRLYGSLPISRRRFLNKSSWATRGTLSQLPLLGTFRRSTLDDVHEATPHSMRSRFSDISFARYGARPKTMYDEPLRSPEGEIPDSDAKVNGIRVWYTSYTSIDWLHDAIKDSLRFSKLRRRRKSLRSRVRLLFDKSLGWIIVTIVGFLSAVVAFLVVRSEQWLFDLKEGYCATSIWRAKRFCCPLLEEVGLTSPKRSGELCPSWRLWYQVLVPGSSDNGNNIVEYISYTVIAVSYRLLCLHAFN